MDYKIKIISYGITWLVEAVEKEKSKVAHKYLSQMLDILEKEDEEMFQMIMDWIEKFKKDLQKEEK